MDELDFDLLGLQYELQEYLNENDCIWFVDYSCIECDIGNAEFKVELLCSWGKVKDLLTRWGKTHGFKRIFYSEDKGVAYLRRRSS
jgi:hypothetical protein